MMVLDFGVIGGGILGLATALRLCEQRPGAGIVVIEKELALARHQTGHNSGVIHAGIYYAPGSLKAQLCRAGEAATKNFCTEHGIAFEVCGKLVVATNAVEAERLDALEQRAGQNAIATQRLDGAALAEIEPMVTGIAALLVPSTGIVDYKLLCMALAEQIRLRGGRIILGQAVTAITETGDSVVIDTPSESIKVRQLVACAGLQSDRVARLAGLDPGLQIVPFRGEYFRLPPSRNDIVRHLIYPVPDPDLPFLGIHLTRMIDGSVTVGPNAVLGFAREGYRKSSISFRDVATYASFPGFWRTMRKHYRIGLAEMRDSVWRPGYLQACRKYCPSLSLADLLPAEAGIRAQAVLRDGTLVHDFMLKQTARMLHVLNAPSPAATSALPIAAMITGQLLNPQTT